MSARLFPIGLLLLVALTGCGSRDTASEQAAEPPSECTAEAVQTMLGQFASAETVEQTRRQAGAEKVRVLAPGDAATMDYNPQRLNIDIDESEAIIRLTCG
ncbi:I78 family peptidase inhibitor [Pseudomonas sp. EA_35y_Pfl2_R111]|uniref:I78 family peptidase inhibitor n=1 Tax=Pseudomonas sp. EA_35y_Pfl2_R111 TaxID=3088689 RepID=UPI0030DCF3C6